MHFLLNLKVLLFSISHTYSEDDVNKRRKMEKIPRVQKEITTSTVAQKKKKPQAEKNKTGFTKL